MKVHTTGDALGNPVRVLLTPGQRHDITQAEALIDGFETEAVLGDKGYDANDLVAQIAEAGAAVVIPPRKNRVEARDYDRNLYADRNARADVRPDRAVLQPSEAVPPGGDALREDGPELPAHGVSGLDAHLAPMIVHTP